MSFLLFLRACLFFFSILASATASPCQQKRDSSPDLFASGDKPLDDGSLTLAFATTPDNAGTLSSDYADPGVSIFSSSTDGSDPAAVNDLIQTPNPDSATGFTSDGGTQGSSGSLFLGADSEGFSGENLVADLPNFGGITDFQFKDPEVENSCPADGTPTTQSGTEKLPQTTLETPDETPDEADTDDELTEEDKRKCPSVGGKQPIALCCISRFEYTEKVQKNCQRRTCFCQFLSRTEISKSLFFIRFETNPGYETELTTPSLCGIAGSLPFSDCSGPGFNWERCCEQYFGQVSHRVPPETEKGEERRR